MKPRRAPSPRRCGYPREWGEGPHREARFATARTLQAPPAKVLYRMSRAFAKNIGLDESNRFFRLSLPAPPAAGAKPK